MSTISSGSTVGITLSSPGYYNPIVINPGVTISGLVEGVFGGFGFWTIQNGGSIAGGASGVGSNYGGIVLLAAGSITNQSAGTISGYDDGIFGDASLTVVNAGSISANGTLGDGIVLEVGGSVTNQSGGMISAVAFGIIGVTVPVTIVNAGRIAGSPTGGYGTGIHLSAGGRVTNQSGGTISGNNGVYGAGNITNAGLIAGNTTSGVVVKGGGRVTNQSGGSITGVRYGLNFSIVAGTVFNAGHIVASGSGTTVARGVALLAGGYLSNAATGTISSTGNGNAIRVQAAVGTVVNSGTIMNNYLGRSALALQAGGSVINMASGLIQAGAWNGIYGTGGMVTIANAGTIKGHGANSTGVNLQAGGDITNQSTASISGFKGIYGNNVTVTVVNGASITGNTTASSGRGVALQAGGSITNQTTGSINGFIGVYVTVAASTVINAGSITGNTTTAGSVVSSTVVLGGGGAYLLSGGAVTNQTGGVISGHKGIVSGTIDALTVVNAGNIVGNTTASAKSLDGSVNLLNRGMGIDLNAGGNVTNQSGATISGYDGIAGYTGTLTIVNSGSIAGDSAILGGVGVYLKPGGSVTNQINATISGYDAIYGFNGPLTVINSGVVTGALYQTSTVTPIGVCYGRGVDLEGGGSITNQSRAIITGYWGISGGDGFSDINGGPTSTVSNAGTIEGNGTASSSHFSGMGIWLRSGGDITNQSDAVISGFTGIYGGKFNALTVVNAGTISGAKYGVQFVAGQANHLAVVPGAVLSGTVTGGNTIGASVVSTLELTSAASTGTLSGLGTQFINFAQTTIDANASWTLTGANILAAGATLTNTGTLTLANGTLTSAGTMINNGTVIVDPSTLTLAALNGTGAVVIGSGGTVNALGTVAAGEAIAFAPGGTNEVLTLGAPLSMSALIENFATGDAITFAGNYGTVAHAFSGNTMTVTGDGATIATLTFTPGYSDSNTAVSDVNGTVTVLANTSPIITINNNKVTVVPPTGQAFSLDQLASTPQIAPGGTIQSLVLSGSGTNSVSGTISVVNLEMNGGNLSLAGGTVNTDPVTIDAQGNISGFGTVTGAVSNAGTITASGGTLALTNSVTGVGTLIAVPGATLRLDAGGGAGVVTINGGSLAVAGEFDSGQSGLGGLLVENQATATIGTRVVNGQQGLYLAKTAGASGNAVVTGALSLLSNTGQFVVGDAGVGSLAIQSGGTVTTAPGSIVALAGAVIARGAGASGSSVNVSGAGSNWQVNDALVVGQAGLGELTVTQGGTVGATSLDEAAAVTGNAVVAVVGTGSALNIAGLLTVGDQSASELSVLGGGLVTALNANIGLTPTGSGNVDIEGAGSTLRIGTKINNVVTGGDLNVGVAGGGVITVGVGATLTATHAIVIGGLSTLNNLGGTVDPDTIVNTSANGSSALGLTQAGVYIANESTYVTNGGTGTIDTLLVQTGTDVADVQANIGNGILGIWQIGSLGVLVMNTNTVDAGQVVLFSNKTAELVIGQDVTGGPGVDPVVQPGAANVLPNFNAQIWGYVAGNQILFSNLTVASDSVSGNTVTLFDGGHNTLGSLSFFNKFGAASTTAATAAAAQIVPCYAAGTRIETMSGPRAVETLRVGDEVRTVLGGPGRIVWVGSRTVDCARHPRPETVWPVRIAKGAFSPGLPVRDLLVSPDHAIYVDDVLIPAKLLINGTSIRQVKRRLVAYHHIELARHDVVLAEGLPAETYLDAGDRAKFSGGAVVALYPDFAERFTQSVAQMWETRGAAPLVLAGPELAAARAVVAAQAALCGSLIERTASRAG